MTGCGRLGYTVVLLDAEGRLDLRHPVSLFAAGDYEGAVAERDEQATAQAAGWSGRRPVVAEVRVLDDGGAG